MSTATLKDGDRVVHCSEGPGIIVEVEPALNKRYPPAISVKLDVDGVVVLCTPAELRLGEQCG